MEQTLRTRRPAQPAPIEQLLEPFQEFFHGEATSGIVLIVFTVIALVWANSPWGDSYQQLWETKLSFQLGGITVSHSLHHWINDGLMAIFFFVVGLEIKREVIVGELASLRKAMLPIGAAVGGMAIPALIYAVINAGGPGAAGWGVPMATDIAFALGILSLFGDRIPITLTIFLTALAIVDDIGAVLVIALFYTADITWLALGIAGIVLLLLILMNRLDVRHPLVYGLLGIALWAAFLESGIHATVAGVLLALTIPARTRVDADQFLQCSQDYLEAFEQAGVCENNILTNPRQQGALQALESACEKAQAPLQRFEHSMHPWIGFAIMPIFALANAGIVLGGDALAGLASPIAVGVAAGLIVGKQLGVMLAALLLIRTKIADMPLGVTWRHIYGASWLAGIGFTMSFFIGSLAFSDQALLNEAKIGILIASVVATLGGALILWGAKSEPVTIEEACA